MSDQQNSGMEEVDDVPLGGVESSFGDAVKAAAQSEQLSQQSESDEDAPAPADELETVDLNHWFQPNETVTLDSSPFVEKAAGVSTRYGRLPLPSWNLEEIEKLWVEQGLDTNLLDTSLTQKQIDELPKEQRELREHLLLLLHISTRTLQKNYHGNTLNQEGSSWGQGVQYDGDKWLRTAKSKLNPRANPVLRINQELGLTGLYQIPLWHTGIWLTISTPMDSSWLEMERRLSIDKVNLGRESNGRIYSAHEVYTMDIVIDFILDHVHGSTAPNSSPEYLREIIKISDIPGMLLGMATAQYPNGYPFTQPCLAKPNECRHEVHQIINLAKVLWVDSGKLTERQKKHMMARTTTTTAEALKLYQDDFAWKVSTHMPLNKTTTLVFEVPTLKKYQDTGYRWVAEVRERTNQAFGTKLQGEQRELYMRQWARFETLRQYGHYFSAIVKDGDLNVETERLDDPEQIDQVVSAICKDSEMVENISKHLHALIDASCVAMVAVPREACPSCGEAPPVEYLKHPHLIPLDVAAVFFILGAQRIAATLTTPDPV